MTNKNVSNAIRHTLQQGNLLSKSNTILLHGDSGISYTKIRNYAGMGKSINDPLKKEGK